MAATNRAAKITKLLTALKKHYKPVDQPSNRSLIETLLFACLLENAEHADAEAAFAELKQRYFDWNEVRVSTKRELAEAMKPLPEAESAAARLKDTLHSVFETFYSFDIEAMKKQNLGQSVKQFEKLNGSTRFVVSYTAQNALGGHSIAVNDGLLVALHTLDIITDAEATTGAVPGLERAVPKNKGIEVGSILHQLGVEVGRNPYGQNARKRLLAIDPKCKDRLPKRPPKPAPKPVKKTAKPAEKPPVSKGAPKKTEKPAEKKPAAKKAAPKAAQNSAAKATKKSAPVKKKKLVKKKLKKAPTKKAAKKSVGKKKVKKKSGKPVKKKKKTAAKRKPR